MTKTPVADNDKAHVLFQVEVANIAWSLVAPRDASWEPRHWRALTPAETMDVFDRLMAAVTRHNRAVA